MQKVIDYFILAEPSGGSDQAYEMMAARVKMILARGFQPFGGPFMDAKDDGILFQAMVKYEET